MFTYTHILNICTCVSHISHPHTCDLTHMRHILCMCSHIVHTSHTHTSVNFFPLAAAFVTRAIALWGGACHPMRWIPAGHGLNAPWKTSNQCPENGGGPPAATRHGRPGLGRNAPWRMSRRRHPGFGRSCPSTQRCRRIGRTPQVRGQLVGDRRSVGRRSEVSGSEVSGWMSLLWSVRPPSS